MTLGLIWAQGTGGAIGAAGELPWHLPEDLAHFKEVTGGSAVIMGRRTWDSLPDRFRPLPGRRNIVITRKADWNADGAETADSVERAIELAGEDVWVIGGGEIYAATIELADRLEVTEVRLTVDGDTFAPRIDDRWERLTAPDAAWLTSRTGTDYRFASYAAER